LTIGRLVSLTEDEADILARARAAKRHLEAVIDRMQGSNALLDPEPLAELVRVLNQETYPAASAYARLLASRYPLPPSSPRPRGGGK
jgi:hypothetical protein